MKQLELKTEIRQGKGKSFVGKLRDQGWIPAVVYGKAREPISLQVPEKEFLKALQGAARSNVIVTLVVGNGSNQAENKTAMIKERQQHPLSGQTLHIDFYEISLTEAIEVNVPVIPKGEAMGVKLDGGVLDHSLWELHIFCLPTQIPNQIEVDVSSLKIGQAIHVKEVVVPEGVKILTDPELTIFSVKRPTEEKAASAETEAETAEPEVIREKKVEAEATGEPVPAKEKEASKSATKEQKGS